MDCIPYLWEAMQQIAVPEALFAELLRQVHSGERDPDYHPDREASIEDELYYFLDGLCDMEYIAYHHGRAERLENIAASLTRSAAQQGLPPVPERCWETHTEMPGAAAAAYLAATATDWRVFTIDSGRSPSFYVGVVSRVNAGAFLNRISTWFLETGCTYCAHLLDKGV